MPVNTAGILYEAARRARKNIVINEADTVVGEDGVRRCRRCGEALEFFASFAPSDEAVKIPCICSCLQEEERRENLRCAVQERKNRCFPTPNMFDCTFENSNGKVPKLKVVQSYVENWTKMRRDGRGLLLYGPVGTGKSYAACCAANYLCEQNKPVKLLNMASFLNELQQTRDRTEYIQTLTNGFALLIIDDFGIERDTGYAMEQIFNIIDGRCSSGKPLIVTTNVPIRVMREEADIGYQRIFDRITAMCQPVLFDGMNQRDGIRSGSTADLKACLAAGGKHS